MRTDLAALTPPLVMAAAFITGVVVLLRREMAPRRRGGPGQPGGFDSAADPHGEMSSPVFTQARGGRQNGDGVPASDDNSARNHAAGSGPQDLRGRQDDGGMSRAEDHPPVPPNV
jgi:hypothetical protein